MRACKSTNLRRNCHSSSTRTAICWKKSPSTARRGGCGEDHARSFPGQGSALAAAEVPRADGWVVSHRAAARNNIVRVAIQALAAILGGCQSLHTNSMDEALALPTEESALIALRTQQIIANETGVTNTIDPVAGSYAIESLTEQIETRAQEYLSKIDAMGGMIKAIESGFVQTEIQRAAYDYQRGVESKDNIVVGVNDFVTDDHHQIPTLRIDAEIERAQVARLRRCARNVIRPGPRRPSQNSSGVPEHPKICCRLFSPPSRPTPRSAKSPTPCAKSTENTRNLWSFEPRSFAPKHRLPAHAPCSILPTRRVS